MFRPHFLLIFALLLPLGLQAHNLRIGELLPSVSVADQGELLYQNNEFSYNPWNSARLGGKFHLIQLIAARTSASQMNAALMASIKHANLPHHYYQTTTIIEGDNYLFSSDLHVHNWLENTKKMSPLDQLVFDKPGNVRKTWQLRARNSAIVVVDVHGRVRYIKEGALTLAEIHQVADLLHCLLADSTATNSTETNSTVTDSIATDSAATDITVTNSAANGIADNPSV
jgi:hypothetical protein